MELTRSDAIEAIAILVIVANVGMPGGLVTQTVAVVALLLIALCEHFRRKHDDASAAPDPSDSLDSPDHSRARI
jgi:hypothetical protein